ncbi:DUF2726 domain-containing protein [Caulobacter sp. RHG1]|uniref:DUF2726 domain-containing protein n=1 Tax=Caulobacter sp. (strain RHG1) TaxID=2545762 RepID=UPI001553C0F6|nr:DUF2726 domain-containing protein [Caulobacter sp. RHG1]NQE63172.1 hypothetical protein [Caulobacter sp. RHG1]
MRRLPLAVCLTSLAILTAPPPARAADALLDGHAQSGALSQSQEPKPAKAETSAEASRKTKRTKSKHARRAKAKRHAKTKAAVHPSPPKPAVRAPVISGRALGLGLLAGLILAWFTRRLALFRRKRQAPRNVAPIIAPVSPLPAQIRAEVEALPHMAPRAPYLAPPEAAPLSHQALMLEVLREALDYDPEMIRPKPLLNWSEKRLFETVLEAWTYERRLRLLAQVSLGECLETHPDLPKADASEIRRTFNGKRVDFLVCDWAWQPVFAVEYFGGGHDLDLDWQIRDTIKAEALASAGVGLVIVEKGDSTSKTRDALDAALASIDAVRHVAPVYQKWVRQAR